jgi:hypothetical protein
MKKIAWLFPLLFAAPLFAQTDALQGYCDRGGTHALVSGLPATNWQLGTVPGCTVTVYLTGTTAKATLYSDSLGTPLGNPFTATLSTSPNPGYWIFWAATGQGYDVTMSGGGNVPTCTTQPNCYAIPITKTDLKVGSGGGGTGLTFFSAGNNPPLFNTTVTNPGTTPNLAFNPIQQSAQTVFGNFTGASAQPFFAAYACTGLLGCTYNAGSNTWTLNVPSTSTLSITTTDCIKVNGGNGPVSSGTANISQPGCTTPPSLEMEVTPPASGNYVVLYPSTLDYATGSSGYCAGWNAANPTGYGVSFPSYSGLFTSGVCRNTLSNWVYADGSSWPGAINPANVTAVYAVSINSFQPGTYNPPYVGQNFNGAPALSCASVSVLNNAPNAAQVNGLTSLTGATIAAATCNESITQNSSILTIASSASLSAPLVALYVYSTDAPTPSSTALNIGPYLSYDRIQNLLTTAAGFPNFLFPNSILQLTNIEGLNGRGGMAIVQDYNSTSAGLCGSTTGSVSAIAAWKADASSYGWYCTPIGSGSGGGTATNILGGALGSIPYQSAPGTTAFLAGNTTTAKEFLSQTGTGTVSAAPVLGVLASTDIPAINLAGTGNGGVTGTLPYTSLAALSANQVLGALTATTPSGLNVPSCSGASNALIWTSGTGFGCNTITASGLTFPATVSGTVNSGGIPYFSSATQMSSSALLSQYGIMYGGGTGAAPTTTTAPTANGLYQLVYNVTGGAAVAPTAVLPGLNPRDVSGTTASDTILYSDNGQIIEYTGTVAVATSLPTPTTLGNAAFWASLENRQTNTVTVTPATWTINGASSLAITAGQRYRINIDPTNATNWLATLLTPTLPATIAAVTHEWINSYTASTGVFTQTQPAFADISGTATIGQGGTGATTAPTALSNLAANPSAGTYSLNCTSGTSCGVSAAPTGTVTDGSGVTTANELAVSTTTAHVQGYVTTLPTAAEPAHTGDVTNTAGSLALTIPAGTVTGAKMANNTVTATQLAAQYSKGSCTELWGGSGTSFALTAGDDAISNNSCYNDSGVTRTITAVKCRSDVASNTTTVNPTFGSAGTGTTILSAALTCGSSLAYSASGTVTNAAWTTGTGINPVMGGTLTGTSIAVIVEYTY